MNSQIKFPNIQLKRSCWIMAAALWLVFLGLGSGAGAEEPSLLDRYPTTLTTGDPDPGRARPWEFTKSDVFGLTDFSFQLGAGFRVETGPADLGLGHCADGAVWAVVIPRATGRLTSEAANEAEAILHVWLRFHPLMVDELFPPTTVMADGDQSLAAQMRVIAGAKLRSSWHAGNNVMIPEPKDMTVDADIQGSVRRFFVVDTVAVTAEYIPAFESRPVPVPPAISLELAASAFDQLWQAFDEDYAMFVLRPGVDWAALRDQTRPLALASRSTYELAGVCADMLRTLRDLHVWLTVSGVQLPVYDRTRHSNANPGAYATLLGALNTPSSSLHWAVTTDKIGFVVIHNWVDASLPAQFDAAIENMRDTRGMIIDVRLNGGGDETLAQQVAARFLDQEVTYAYSQYRNGPLHTDLTELLPRTLGPRGPFRYDRPVVVLIGQRCMSSNESFIAMMGGAPQVLTMGDRTAGSSGNPKIVELPLTLTVSVPQWIHYLSDATPLDEKGIVPEVPFTAPPEAFQGTRDDLLSVALERLGGEPLPADPIPNPADELSGPTVCDITLTDGRIYHSATLELSVIHLLTEYGELIIPTNDLVRLTFSTIPGADTASTIRFVAVGQIQEQSFFGHTPGGPFEFQRGELEGIEFGLPSTLAARLPEVPLRVLWFRDSRWEVESIYRSGGLGYSQAALVAENLGAGNMEVTEQEKLTPELLSTYHLVVFLNRDSGGTLSADEKRALRDFLGAGNGVLVIGQQDGGWPLSPAAQFANSVTMPYGIELTTMTPNIDTPSDSSQLIVHPVTRGLASAPGGGSLLRATVPAQILALTGTNTGVLAVSTYGKGRMVVVSDDSNLWDSTIDPNYGWNGQGHRLAVNIFKWLLIQPPRLDACLQLDESGCHFSFRAGATHTIHLQRSTDLITWTDWETLTATGAWQQVLDEEEQMHGRQFYRALLVP